MNGFIHRSKRKSAAILSIFMAVLISLTSSVPVSAFDQADAPVVEANISSEALQPDNSESSALLLSEGIDTSDDNSPELLLSDENNISEELLLSDEPAQADGINEINEEINSSPDEDLTPTEQTSETADTSAAVNAEEDSEQPIEIKAVNPLYADVVDESEIPLPSEVEARRAQDRPEIEAEGTVTSPTTYTSISAAGDFLRSCMKKHESEIIININIPSSAYSDTSSLWNSVLNRAKVHTGTGTEGDSISYQYGGTGGSTSTHQLIYTPYYYTTLAQEAELSTKVSDVLKSLDLNGCTDEWKSAKIYKYITDYVKYDNANLKDNSYKLKYTAYAALCKGTSVCQGYSVLFYRMALEAGVDSRVISGKGNGSAHAWNIVRINGKYYNLDSTWDAGKTPAAYKYYLNNTTFDNSHVRDTISNSGLNYAGAEFNRQYPMSPTSLAYPTGNNTTIVTGQKIDLKEVCFSKVGGTISRYIVDNKKIASVSKTMLKGSNAGTVRITAQVSIGKNKYADVATCTVKVLNKPKLKFTRTMTYDGQTINALDFFTTSDTKTLGATYWESSKPNIVEVIDSKKGILKAHNAGSAQISAYFGEKGKKGTLKVTASVSVKKPSFAKNEYKLQTGGSLTLSMKNVVKGCIPQWSVANTNIASAVQQLDKNKKPTGKVIVRARNCGDTTLTAVIDGQKYNCKIHVDAPLISKNALTVKNGKTVTVSLKNTKLKKTDIKWESANPNIATVNTNGTIKGISPGTTKIYTTTGGIRNECTVTVN